MSSVGAGGPPTEPPTTPNVCIVFLNPNKLLEIELLDSEPLFKSNSSGNRVLLDMSRDEKLARNEFGECCWDKGGVRGPVGWPALWPKPDRPPKLLLTRRVGTLPERSDWALPRGPGLGDDILAVVWDIVQSINLFQPLLLNENFSKHKDFGKNPFNFSKLVTQLLISFSHFWIKFDISSTFERFSDTFINRFCLSIMNWLEM